MHLSQQQYDQLRLFRSYHVGPIIYKKLIARYGSAAEALQHFDDINKQFKKSLKAAEKKHIDAEISALEKAGGNLVFIEDAAYPTPLKLIDDAPPVLSVLGDIQALNKPYIALVGNRNASAPALQFTKKIAAELCQKNFGVISGLARGVDTAAHQGALSVNGLTIAVLAGGVNHIYPPENKKLYADILQQGGAIISEMPWSIKPTQNHFPRRNRLVSGISLGVAVIECPKRSGSLITARLALEQNRDVFAVPGSPLESRSEGPNHLIRSGAHMLTCVEDIVENHTTWIMNEIAEPSLIPREIDPIKAHLAQEIKTLEPATRSTPKSEDIFDSLHDEILSLLSAAQSTVMDTLIQQTGQTETDLSAALSELELDDKIVRTVSGFLKK